MYFVVHLIHVCPNEKGKLNFVSERIKLVYRINVLGTGSTKLNKLPKGQTSKTTIYRLHTSELKLTSKYQLLTFQLKNFEKCMTFYTLP